jgi:hypothetical protein
MIIIKTEKKIGEFLDNSSVDNIPLRRINSLDELKEFEDDDYQIIKMPSTPIIDIEKAKGNSFRR